MKITCLFILFLLCITPWARKKVIYGLDQRVFLAEVKDSQLQKWGESIAGLVDYQSLLFNSENTTYKLRATTLGEQAKLCQEEPFFDLTSVFYCTGFLVAPNLLVTSGHCVDTQEKCESFFYVFTHRAGRVNAPESFPDDDVYRCKKLIDQKRDFFTLNDFALIELDRFVSNRTPLLYRKKGKLSDDAGLLAIGHGLGLPLVYTGEGIVRENNSDYVFYTDLDTFVGNSGSPLINTKTGTVEGILSDGERDFIYDEKNNCNRTKQCLQNSCKGEVGVRINRIPKLVPGEVVADEPSIL